MRARLFVVAIAGITVVANLWLGVAWLAALAAGLAVLVVGEVAGRVLSGRRLAAARSGGVRPPAPVARAGGHPLSPRELEVAVLIAKGLKSKEVGNKLDIERGTVDKHIEHIYDKLGFDSRPQLAIWLMERGLLERDDQEVNTT
jgi:DNA-binding NarL/FixJ family response regulator